MYQASTTPNEDFLMSWAMQLKLMATIKKAGAVSNSGPKKLSNNKIKLLYSYHLPGATPLVRKKAIV